MAGKRTVDDIEVGGKAARRPDGSVIPRPVDIPGLGRTYIKPLPYGAQIEFFENRPDSHRTTAALYRRQVVHPDFVSLTAHDVRRMWPTDRALIQVAILKASDMFDADIDDAAEDDPEPTQTPDDAEAVENGVFGQDDAEGPTESDPDLTHADQIDLLHQLDYRWSEIYGLLTEEIQTVVEGAKRRQERQDGSDDDGVRTKEGTTVKGGPAQGTDSITMVDEQGDPLTD